MKNIIAITASLVMMGLSFAEYTVVIGLPQDSIKFATPTPPEPECKYDVLNNNWVNGRNTAYSLVHIFDNGVQVYDGKDIYTTSHIIGNYKYTRGDLIGIFGDYEHHYVCKLSI